MPPCAQTECERFTGTIENKSTGTPDSATRIAAISPARPPPTMMIFGFLIRGVSLGVCPQREPSVVQPERDGDACDRQHGADNSAKVTSGALRTCGHRNTPLAGEIPEPVAEMEGEGRDAHNVKSQIPGIRHRMRHIRISGHSVSQKSLGVQMPSDENEGDHARPALQDVQPVAHPGMGERIRLPSPPDVHAVEPVEENRQPNNSGFHQDSPGNRLKLTRNLVVFLNAYECVAVGPEMVRQIRSNGNNSAE